jgi:hypothetical protein
VIDHTLEEQMQGAGVSFVVAVGAVAAFAVPGSKQALAGPGTRRRPAEAPA